MNSIKCSAVIATAVALLLVSPSYVASFQLHRPVSTAGLSTMRTFTAIYSENPKEEEVVGEQYEGSVDWDAEWKKVVENRDQPSKRPGNYKSQAEIAVTKATNKVAKNVYDASKEMKESLPSTPSIRSLQGDWRFWIGILVIVSFGLSILSATSTAPVNDSFYI